MAVEEITLDELQAAFRDAGFTGNESDEGKTIEELVSAWGVSRTRATDMLQRAHKLGILKAGRRLTTRIDGATCRIPVYSVIAGGQPKAKSRRGK